MNKKLISALSILLFFVATPFYGQSAKDEAKLVERLQEYFWKYKPKGTRLTQPPRMLDYQLDNTARTLTIVAYESFAAQEFTTEITEHIYKKVK
jgi:hypothetical protein